MKSKQTIKVEKLLYGHNSKKGYLMFFLFFCLSWSLQAQITVTGKITDAEGESLIGVNVQVKGTDQGTSSDIDGIYKLESVERDAVIIFSYIGYQTVEIEVDGRSNIDVVMSTNAALLEEVVVVGYGTKRAGEVTGAISSIQSKDLEEMSIVNASEALRSVSGVTVLKSNTPGEGASIRIRGLGTINDNNPLWVVDGVPGGSVSPHNIASISILKDAASQAIYGARAANGVVLVTTKSGRKNQEAQLSVNVKTGISKNTNYYDLLNTREYGELLWLQAKNDGVPPSHPLYGDGSEPDIPEYIRPARATNVDESLYDDKMIHEDGDDTYLIMKANKEGTNWLQEADRNAQFRDISVDLSGGSEATSYAFQLGYLDEEGILKHTGYNRYNIRSNVTTSPTSWIEIGERVGVTYTEDYGHQGNNSESSIISWAYRMQPIIPVHDIKGNYAGTRAEGTGNAQNPIFLLDANKDDKTRRMNISGNTYLKITPIEGLEIQTLFGLDHTSRHYRNPNFVEKAHAERGKYASLSEETSFSTQWNWTNTIEFSKQFASIHDLTLLVGSEAINYNYNFDNASRSEFFSKNANYIQLATGLQSINNDGNKNSWSLFSLFGRFNYSLDNTYLLEGVIRRDGSSRFGTTNSYGIFPAVSAAWRMTNENFMTFSSSWLQELKVRVGYGITGNDRIGNYNSYTNFDINYFDSFYPINGANSTTGATGFYQSTFGNPNVKWETTSTTNFGIEAIVLNNINFSIDIWKRETSDMLFPKQIPLVLGRASPPSVNVGEMENNGFDFEIGYFNSALNGEFNYNLN